MPGRDSVADEEDRKKSKGVQHAPKRQIDKTYSYRIQTNGNLIRPDLQSTLSTISSGSGSRGNDRGYARISGLLGKVRHIGYRKKLDMVVIQ